MPGSAEALPSTARSRALALPRALPYAGRVRNHRSWRRPLTVTFLLLTAWLTAIGAARAEEKRPGLVDEMRDRILAHLALRPGLVVADIGIGGGWFVVRVAEAIGPDGVVYGTDIDPNAITTVGKKVPDLKAGAGRVDLRLCRDGRDTALDDLPAGSVDLILMVDSLCFDAGVPRETNVAYLSRFLRILRPGGRLVHHMDCRCDVSTESVHAQFADAGFSSRVESFDVSPDPALIETGWPCRSDAERARHGWVGVFRKPESATDAGVPGRGAY